ncbi:MAG: hypothetical protein H0X40_17975 [Chthoniobacterales bacterium]|nr:hypothetical protein [Chthoniobacterales bacterium]
MHSSINNVIGWVLTICGLISSVAALCGLLYWAVKPNVVKATEIASALHDTYYIIHRARITVICPLLLCLALSAATTIVGYMLTTHYIARTLKYQEANTPKT